MKKKLSIKTISLEEYIRITKKDLEKKIIEMISDKKILSIIEGGKRLRPLLANLAFKVCTQGKENNKSYQKALEGGVVIELAHAASLVHDDIIDNDKKRRGKPSYFIKNGIAGAILTGHKMLVLGFDVALKHGEEWAKLYVDSWDEVIDGEIDEIKLIKNGFKSEDINSKSKIFDKYIHIIDFKTAALFSSVCKAGVLEAKKSDEILEIFSNYGREIGIAYQLADDLVDLEKGEMIDSVIVPLLNRLNGDKMKIKSYNKILIRTKFAKNREKIQKIYLDEIEKHIKKAEELSKSEKLPNSIYKNLVKEFPRYIINEMLKEINITI